MPVFLVHGFRWPRDGLTGVRVHTIVHNLDNVSAEYIQNERSRQNLLQSFRDLYPDIMKRLETPGGNRSLQFIEQYDPDDDSGPDSVSQPYAFVGDRVVVLAAGQHVDLCQQFALSQVLPKSPAKPRAKVQPLTKAPPFTTPHEPTALSANVEEIVAEGPGSTAQAWEALADLRDKIADEEKIGWWVVYNGDPVRAYDDDGDEDEGEDGEEEELAEELHEEPRHMSNDSAKSDGTTSRSSGPGPTLDGRQPGSIRAALSKLSMRDKALPSPPLVRDSTDTQGSSSRPKQKEDIPEPARAKQIAKEKGIRHKFFGKRA